MSQPLIIKNLSEDNDIVDVGYCAPRILFSTKRLGERLNRQRVENEQPQKLVSHA